MASDVLAAKAECEQAKEWPVSNSARFLALGYFFLMCNPTCSTNGFFQPGDAFIQSLQSSQAGERVPAEAALE